MYSVLHEKYYDIGLTDQYLVQTQLQDKIQWDKTTRGSWSKEKFYSEYSLCKLYRPI